jgi:molecular chaperone DnaK
MRIWDRGRLRHSVGIETKGGRFTPLIPKGARLPASVTETFTTADPDQPSIQLKPYQGESPPASRNQQLGHFDVTEIPPANPGEPLIYVTFHVDARGELSITARDERNGDVLPVLRR